MNNKTSNFMYAFCSDFGNEFLDCFVIGLDYELYLGDYNYKNYKGFTEYKKFINDDIIFALISPKRKNDLSFDKRIMQLQSHENYITDYEIEENKRMVVFRVDEPHRTALRMLKQGRYSKMYISSNIEKWFSDSKKFHIMYVDKNGQVKITKDNCDTIPDLEKNYTKINYSLYHILKKSPALKELLECILKTEIEWNAELSEGIDCRKEVYNYNKKEIKLLQA